ncbi:hypothetical protein [uncultured Thiohalocapsa sp.]|uniref:hypothetical protein n=1 Tax=uncultured Thiohalocapsa sp. TaxID=768990 RepID=UPI0025EF514E|nr:hypothetical protein [uncultured Thiohalocapsa sp.]
MADGAVPPLVPILLYNGASRWSAAVELAELIAHAPGRLDTYRSSSTDRHFMQVGVQILLGAPA